MNLFYVNAAGFVVATQSVPDDAAVLQSPPEGCVGYPGSARMGQRLLDGALVDIDQTPSYTESRLIEYPNHGDQLDDLWRLVGSLAKQFPDLLPTETAARLKQIEAVKAAIPKE